MNTEELIFNLSKQPKTKQFGSPIFYSKILSLFIIIYTTLIQIILGIREDLSIQFTRILFSLEIFLLVGLLASSLIASVFSIHPDFYQRKNFLKLPYLFLILLIILLIAKLFLTNDLKMKILTPHSHNIECALCIAAISIIPSANMLLFIKKGATIIPYQAGILSVLTASAIGCLTLRFAENIDAIPHLICWHYIPTFVFSIIGALVGRYFLKW